jgi:hypothetical protein
LFRGRELSIEDVFVLTLLVCERGGIPPTREGDKLIHGDFYNYEQKGIQTYNCHLGSANLTLRHVHKLSGNGGADSHWRRRGIEIATVLHKTGKANVLHRPGLERQDRRLRIEGEHTHDRF